MDQLHLQLRLSGWLAFAVIKGYSLGRKGRQPNSRLAIQLVLSQLDLFLVMFVPIWYWMWFCLVSEHAAPPVPVWSCTHSACEVMTQKMSFFRACCSATAGMTFHVLCMWGHTILCATQPHTHGACKVMLVKGGVMPSAKWHPPRGVTSHALDRVGWHGLQNGVLFVSSCKVSGRDYAGRGGSMLFWKYLGSRYSGDASVATLLENLRVTLRKFLSSRLGRSWPRRWSFGDRGLECSSVKDVCNQAKIEATQGSTNGL